MRLLLVEDNIALAEALARALKQSGYAIDIARSGKEADGWLGSQQYDLILLDLGLPDGDGAEVLRRYRARKRQTPVLVLSARDAVDARRVGPSVVAASPAGDGSDPASGVP